MINRLVVATGLLILIACGRSAPEQSASATPTARENEFATQQTIVALYRALSSHDSAAYRVLCTEDYLLLEGGRLMNLEEDIAAFTSPARKLRTRTDQLDFHSTRILGDAAHAVYLLTSRFDSAGTVSHKKWLESVVLIRSAGRWKVSLLHSTRVMGP